MSPTLQEVVDAIRAAAAQLSRPPSRSEFRKLSGMTERHVLNHFSGWNNAVRAAGLAPHTGNVKLDDDVLLEDWGLLVRKHRQIPTREQYRREGNFSPGCFEKHFGPWSAIPAKFREYAKEKPDWADVVTLLPTAINRWVLLPSSSGPTNGVERSVAQNGRIRHTKLADRATYGNPIDFRGLRHEPVNEQGVIFLFGMVA